MPSPIQITLSDDGLEAWLEIPDGVKGVGRVEILRALAAAEVRHGIRQAEVAKLVEAASESRGLRVLVARGEAPQEEREPRLKVLVESGQTIGTSTRDGKFDFRERSFATSVRKDQVLALWHDYQPPVPGKGVDGMAIPVPGEPHEERERATEVLLHGEGWKAEILGEGLWRLRANQDGILRHAPGGDVLDVDPVLEIQGDVGLATGNIRARADVIVHGCVNTGSSIETTGSLLVKGAVEMAHLRVAKNLTVEGDLLGGAEGTVEVEGDLTIKHARNILLTVSGDVHILEGCVDVHVECGGRIEAMEGRGRLRGGTYDAQAGLRAREIGSPSGVRTLVRAGANPELMSELNRVERDLTDASAALQKLRRKASGAEVRRVIQDLDPDQIDKVRDALRHRQSLASREKSLQLRREELLQQLSKDGQIPTVEVHSLAHAGAVIQILNTKRVLQEDVGACCFYLDLETGKISFRDLPIAA